MPELGTFAQTYKEAFEHWQQDAERQQANPGAADTYFDSMRQSELIMEILDEKQDAPVAQELAAALEDLTDPEVERERANIEAIRDTAAYGLAITEEEIQERLARLPVPEQFSDEDKKFATAYFVTKTLRQLPFMAVQSADSVPAAESTPEPVPEDATTESTRDVTENDPRIALPIKVYKNNVLVLGDGQVVNLERSLDVAATKYNDELFIAAMRLRVLELIGEESNRAVAEGREANEFMPNALWTEALPESLKGKATYDSSVWSNTIAEFIEGINYEVDGESRNLVNLRSNPRRRYYSPGPFNLQFEYLDEDFEGKISSFYALPNGSLIWAQGGRAMHLLAKTTEENPLTEQQLVDAGVLTLQELVDQPFKFSSVISTIRGNIREDGADELMRIVTTGVGEKNPVTGKQPVAYWLEWLDNARNETNEDPALPLAVSPTEPVVPPIEQPITDDAELDSPEKERAEQIHRAHIVATFIYERRDLIEKMGLQPISKAAVEDIAKEDLLPVALAGDDEGKHKRRVAAFDELSNALGGDNIEEFLDQLEARDPRSKLIDYVFDMMQNPEIQEMFEACLDARVVRHDGVKQDDGQITGITEIEYAFPNRGAVLVKRGEQTAVSADALIGVSQETEPQVGNNQATPQRLTNAERRQQQIALIRSELVRPARQALFELRNAGLTSSVTVGRLRGVFPTLWTETIERQIGKKIDDIATKGQISIEDVLFAYLTLNASDEAQSALRSGHVKKALRELISQEIERDQKAAERRQSAGLSA